MISLADAQNIILQHTPAPRREIVLLQDALQRVLAEPVTAGLNLPPFDRSPLDGYAFRCEDLDGKPGHLKVAGSINAGQKPQDTLSVGTCYKIMTGAPVPGDANAVVPQERTILEGNRVFISIASWPGMNVAKAGEDVKKGEMVLSEGTLLEPVQLGILASLGYDTIKVYCRPKVAVIATGTELVPPGEALSSGQIYETNNTMMGALLQKSGAHSLPLGIAGDNVQELANVLLESLTKAEAVVMTGGVSVGESDLVYAALKEIDAQILFWRVAIKPGTPMLMALKNKKPLFCLSGNPAAAYVSFDQLVQPALDVMTGKEAGQRLEVQAVLEHDIAKNGMQKRFIRATCSFREDTFSVKTTGVEKSGVLSSFSQANAFIILSPGAPPPRAGQKVRVQLLNLPQVTGTYLMENKLVSV